MMDAERVFVLGVAIVLGAVIAWADKVTRRRQAGNGSEGTESSRRDETATNTSGGTHQDASKGPR